MRESSEKIVSENNERSFALATWLVFLATAVIWACSFGNALICCLLVSIGAGTGIGRLIGSMRGGDGRAVQGSILGAAVTSTSVVIAFLFSDTPFFSFSWYDLNWADRPWIDMKKAAVLGVTLVGAVTGAATATRERSFLGAGGAGFLAGGLISPISTSLFLAAFLLHAEFHGLAVHIAIITFPIYLLIQAVIGAAVGWSVFVFFRWHTLWRTPAFVVPTCLLLGVLGKSLEPYLDRAHAQDAALQSRILEMNNIVIPR